MRLKYIGNIAWKLLVVLVALHITISLPLELLFKSNSFANLVPDWLVSVVFVLDFIFNINKIKKRRNEKSCEEFEDTRWYQIVLMSADFIAALPLYLLFPLPIFKLFSAFKLVRLHYNFVYLQHKTIKYANALSVLSFTFWFIIGVHALACGWHSLQVHIQHPEIITDYINSLYWTITTLTTVGYGDITPTTNSQKIYAILVQVVGFGVFTFVIGMVASMLMRKDPARARYEENVDGLVSLIHFKTLPKSLQSKILDYYRYMWRNRLGYDESTFLETLPESLETEVALYLKKDVIEKVSIFQKASNEFKREIAMVLKPVFLTPNDYVFKAGDVANEMYFVINGELETLTQSEDRMLTKLQSGDFFGEIALFKNQNRSATIKAITYCDIYALDKQSFGRVIAKYPEIDQQIRTTVESRESNYSIGN